MSVKPELFLEDVGRIVNSADGADVWQVDNLSSHNLFRGRHLPRTIYVVDFPHGVGHEFMLGRPICGPKKYAWIADVSHAMARLFRPMMQDCIAQFIIANGGFPQDMRAARPPLFPDFLPDSSVLKLQRVKDDTQPLGFRVEELAMIGKWWKAETWLHLDECVASGVSSAFFYRRGFAHHRPKRLFTFPVIASWNGLEVMQEVCDEHGVEFVPVLNSAIVEVQAQGVDLPNTDLGLQPRTIVTRDFYAALNDRYQGKPICWVGDIGCSMFKVPKHIDETLRHMVHHGWDFDREDFSAWNPMLRRGDFHAEFAKRNPELFRAVERFIIRT